MVIISIMFTFVQNGFDIKKEGVRVFGSVAFKDKPTTITGPFKLPLWNPFFISSLCIMVLGTLISFF